MKRFTKFLLTSALLALSLNASAAFMRGDINNDGVVNITDVTQLIDYLLTTTVDAHIATLDVNGDNLITISDVTTLVNYLLTDNWGDEVPLVTEVFTVNGVSFTMVFVEAGTFTMGATDEQLDVALPDEFPAHEVTLTFDYYMGQTEVTRELWLAVMGKLPDGNENNLHCPVTNVNRFECAIFVDYLTQMTGRVFRMPTEAEWEYAARGGKYSHGYRYAGSSNVNEVAWYNSGGSLHPVADKTPNELGLYDMSGNVSEWCQDWYVQYDSAPQTNPIGPESGQNNVHRGGSWLQPATLCRVSSRFNLNPNKGTEDLGLRLVMNP